MVCLKTVDLNAFFNGNLLTNWIRPDNIGTISNGMNINVEVVKNNNENAVNLIRRFTKRVQGSGVLKRVRSLRYSERTLSKFTKKKKALKRIARTTEVNRLKKLGRM